MGVVPRVGLGTLHVADSLAFLSPRSGHVRHGVLPVNMG